MRVDRPIEKREDDLFGRTYYAKALAECVEDFAIRRETPITIGIQGDWGSGKTSLLNLVKQELGDRYLLVDFNSWVFASELNIGVELIFRVADKIIKAAEKEKKESLVSQLQSSLEYVIQLGESVAMGILKSRGIDVSEHRRKNWETIQFQEYLCEAVQNVLTATDKHAVAIFIDDLDRVPPTKAIEITEAIKNFLDVPGCVFFIACDYTTVQKGLKFKFGFEENSREARQYLDKIFQVCFQMPLYTESERKNYLNECFADEKLEETQIDILNNVIFTLELDNPRTIKRCLGVYKLLSKIQTPADSQSKLELLLLVLLQQYSLPLYHYLALSEEPVELMAQLDDAMERDRGRYFQTLIAQTQESDDKLRKLIELFQQNNFARDWLEIKAYEKFFYLTALTDTDNKPMKRRSKWSKAQILQFIAQIQDSNLREMAIEVVRMMLELPKNFATEGEKQSPKARCFLDYGRGLAPSIILKVSHRKGVSRNVAVFSIWRNDGEFWFFLWDKPISITLESWQATIEHFRQKLFPNIFRGSEDHRGKLKNLREGLPSLSKLRLVLQEMVEVRVRPEPVLTKEEQTNPKA